MKIMNLGIEGSSIFFALDIFFAMERFFLKIFLKNSYINKL